MRVPTTSPAREPSIVVNSATRQKAHPLFPKGTGHAQGRVRATGVVIAETPMPYTTHVMP